MSSAPPIVVALAGRHDDAAPLALAVTFSALTGAPLALATACPVDPLAAPPPSCVPEITAATKARLEEAAATLPNGTEVTVHVHFGGPAAVIHRLAGELDAALVVAGSSHRGHAGRVLAGDTSMRILHGSRVALAVAPRDHAIPARLARIAVAYDGSTESREALAAAVGLALLAGGEVTACTVQESVADRPRAERIAREALELAPAEVVRHADVLTGHPARALAGLSSGFDLIVCGSRGHGTLRAALLGSVVERLVEATACPVLVLPREPQHVLAMLHRRAEAT